MILYGKKYWGVPLLFRIYGSSLPRAQPFAWLALLECALVSHYFEDSLEKWWKHPYPYSTFAWVVGFILVFRSSNAYGRYWEAVTALHTFTARLGDVVQQAITYDADSHMTVEAKEAHKIFCQRIIHAASLMHAVALQNLRMDWDLRNLLRHEDMIEAPPLDARNLAPEHLDHENEKRWSFRFVDLFALRSSRDDRELLNSNMRIPVLGGLLPEEAEALKIGATSGDLAGSRYDSNASERVAMTSTWLMRLLTKRIAEGGISVAAPIQTRIFQMISESLLAFEQCRKIATTPFPFPTAQLLLVLLVLYAVSLPMVMAAWIPGTWLASILTYAAVVTYWAVNEVARDLEDPFVYDPNDLPLPWHQYRLNERLMHILRIAESPIPVMLVPGQDLLEVSETQAYRLQPNLDLLHRVQQASTRQLLRRSGHPAGRLDASPKRRPRARGGMQAVQATQAGAGMDGSREGDDGFSAALSAEQCRLDV